jgi:small subunit ribosomal protein S21
VTAFPSLFVRDEDQGTPGHRDDDRAARVAWPPRSRSSHGDERRAGKGTPLKIEVVDNQIESALKTLKKEMLKEGLFKEMKRRAFYEKPSVKRKRKQAEARKKRRRATRRLQARDD